MGVANIIRESRKQAGLTQEQLAEQVKVTRQTIIALEKGSYVPSLELALDLAHAFGTTVEALFKKTEEEE